MRDNLLTAAEAASWCRSLVELPTDIDRGFKFDGVGLSLRDLKK